MKIPLRARPLVRGFRVRKEPRPRRTLHDPCGLRRSPRADLRRPDLQETDDRRPGGGMQQRRPMLGRGAVPERSAIVVFDLRGYARRRQPLHGDGSTVHRAGAMRGRNLQGPRRSDLPLSEPAYGGPRHLLERAHNGPIDTA